MLFIGDSGKFVAEEVQGLRRFYNLSLPPSLVFDVNTQATLDWLCAGTLADQSSRRVKQEGRVATVIPYSTACPK